MSDDLPKTEAEWRARLSPLQFAILRESGTERAFTGLLTDHFASGTYHCAGCSQPLFHADSKYHSGCGWPAFSAAADGGAVTVHRDVSHGMVRMEVRCSRCEGHLGHVFRDGPAPSYIRYCINSACLDFKPDVAAP